VKFHFIALLFHDTNLTKERTMKKDTKTKACRVEEAESPDNGYLQSSYSG